MADEYIDKVEVGAKIQIMYIRREMDYGGENDFCRGMRKALRVIENMPAADVQPARFARWIDLDNRILCSGCGAGYDDSDEVKQNTYIFCPNCGARMDGDTNG